MRMFCFGNFINIVHAGMIVWKLQCFVNTVIDHLAHLKWTKYSSAVS